MAQVPIGPVTQTPNNMYQNSIVRENFRKVLHYTGVGRQEEKITEINLELFECKTD